MITCALVNASNGPQEVQVTADPTSIVTIPAKGNTTLDFEETQYNALIQSKLVQSGKLLVTSKDTK